MGGCSLTVICSLRKTVLGGCRRLAHVTCGSFLAAAKNRILQVLGATSVGMGHRTSPIEERGPTRLGRRAHIIGTVIAKRVQYACAKSGARYARNTNAHADTIRPWDTPLGYVMR